MILIRKALRIATLAATALALAYYAFNHPNGSIAQWLLILGAISTASAWARIWPAPEHEWTVTPIRSNQPFE